MAQPADPARCPDPADRPAWVDEIDNPYLHGIHAPVVEECAAEHLEVEGELPEALCGAYVRNGPNPVHPPTNQYHWFDGDGMLHGVYFRDGRASYRNRYVQTTGLADERARGQSIWPGIMGPFDFDLPRHYMKDTANTDVIWWNDHLLALWYVCGAPYRLDPATLEDRGIDDFGGALRGTVSSHPKVDERTGELVWFTLADEPPYMTYGVVDSSGGGEHTEPIELPGPRLPHDITITEQYSILHDFPLYHDPAEMHATKHRILHFHRDEPTRFGVLPRRGGNSDVKWFEFAPGYVLHMVNAWEDGDWIVMDGCFQPDPTITRRREEGVLASMLGYFRIRSHLHRWRMNLVTGEAREEPLDDRNVEFPLPDTQRYGVKTRYSYHQDIPLGQYTLGFEALLKYDHQDGSCQRFAYGDGVFGSEAPFAPRPDASAEDDGWVTTVVTDANTLRSECWVFDAHAIERGPCARVKLPARVPTGFHAKWIPGARIWRE